MRGPTIVFCRTKRTCQKTADDLLERGFRSATIHGDLAQNAREKALNDFKAGKTDVLVATDVAARGIDIDGITHVINYQCPEDEKTYVQLSQQEFSSLHRDVPTMNKFLLVRVNRD